MGILRWIGAYVAAVLATGLLGSVTQTQFNLARLGGLGVDVAVADRLNTTVADLTGFAPLFTALTAGGFLVAFLFTGIVLRRWVKAGRPWLYALAGATAIATILISMRMALGLDAIAAARGAGGFLALAACGAFGGAFYARMTRPKPGL